jgi:PEP-CTERM motif
MTQTNTIRKLAIVIVISAAAANADNIRFIGTPTGINDGSFYVLPYSVTINGASQLVACYDIYDDVNVGDMWTAQLLNVAQAASAGYFSSQTNAAARYERIAWLDAQAYESAAQQIGLQYAIWNVFGNYRSSTEAEAYDRAADLAAAGGYAGFDFSGARFIEQAGGVPERPGTEQAFVFWLPISTGVNTGEIGGSVAEPGTLLLLGLGFGVVALLKRRRE